MVESSPLPGYRAPMPGSRRERRWELLFLLVVPFVLLGPIVLAGRVLLPQLPAGLEPLRSEDPALAERALAGANFVQADRLFPTLTDQLALRAALADGELPTWDPGLGLGAPLFAQSIAGTAYPPNWLGLFSPAWMAAPLAALSLFLAGLGMWLFLGRLGLSTGARILGALALQCGGWGTENLFYYMKVDAALWLPWALWAVEGLARGRRWSGLWLTVALACSLVAGMVAIGVFVCGTACLYAAIRLTLPAAWFGIDEPGGTEAEEDQAAARRWPALVSAVVFSALGALAAVVLLWPALEASLQGERQLNSAARVALESQPFGTLAGTVVRDFVGAPTESTPGDRLPVAWWITPPGDFDKALNANQLEWSTYAGVVLLCLALVGLIAAPRRAWLPGGLLLLAFAFAQGWPLVRLAYALPGLNVGAPGRVLAIAWVLWPWLAALGVEAWVRGRARSLETLFGAAFVASTIAFACWMGFEPEGWAHDLEAVLIERYEVNETAADVRERLPFDATVRTGERLATSLALFLGASVALLGAAIIGLLFRRPPDASFPKRASKLRFSVACLCLVVVATLPAAARSLATDQGVPPLLQALVAAVLVGLLAWRRFVPAETPRWLPLVVLLLAEGVVAAHGHVSGRDMGGRPIFPESEAIEAVREAAAGARVIRYDTSASGVGDVLSLARPNMLQPYGIADLSTWILFPAHTTNELFEALDPRTRWRQGVSRIPDPDLFAHPVLDLVRVGAVLSREPLEHPRLEPVLERPGFHVYRRTGAFGPARVVPQAIAATSDEAALALLAGAAVDFELATLIATDDAAALAGEDTPGAFAGTITRFERPRRGRIEIDIAASEGGWLVVHEQHYPGWTARVNGEHARILRADHVYQAVRLPAGDSTVVLRYAPASLRWGPVVTLLALLAAFLLSRRSTT